jgi:protein subunit release factor B
MMIRMNRPPPYRTDLRSLGADTEVEVFTAGGPGGQHRNKTKTGVRLHHDPSGVMVVATERRSLEANRRAAFARLVARLERLNRVPKRRTPTKPTKGSVERRLAEKRRAAQSKTRRRGPTSDE